MLNQQQLHHQTPVIRVLGNHSKIVREIHYYRHPDTLGDDVDQRITLHTFNARLDAVQSIDPRLAELRQQDASVAPNFCYFSSLSGQTLRVDSVDSGTTIALNDIEGRPLFSINPQGTSRCWQYEAAILPGRPLTIQEQGKGDVPRITERFIWATGTAEEKKLNQVGHWRYHYDSAGRVSNDAISLSGQPLTTTRQWLIDDAEADWVGDTESAWLQHLQPEKFTTTCTTNALNDVITQCDVKGNIREMTYDVAGLLFTSSMTINGAKKQTVVKSVHYSPAGQLVREEHGNGIVTTYAYEAETQRLINVRVTRPQGKDAGKKRLQDLYYQYDPVGNAISMENKAETPLFWCNQQVEPKTVWIYDTLYQLVSASGREAANAGRQSQSLPAVYLPHSGDHRVCTNYQRRYQYDRGGNLTQIRHHAPASYNNYTLDITVCAHSNRAIASSLADTPEKAGELFDPAGNQLLLSSGQQLHWGRRGELRQVSLHGGPDDENSESYRYDGNSQRTEKLSLWQQGETLKRQQTYYFTHINLHTRHHGERLVEALQTILIAGAGGTQIRGLHWDEGLPDGVENNQLRYSYASPNGDVTLELDQQGDIITQEEYYPYGGTALWAARSQTDANYKTVRYSGKERDATGLYYYGFRYYQCQVGRWISSDPDGPGEGLNLYCMVRNNPVTLHDIDGRAPAPLAKMDSALEEFESASQSEDIKAIRLYADRLDAITSAVNTIHDAVDAIADPTRGLTMLAKRGGSIVASTLTSGFGGLGGASAGVALGGTLGSVALPGIGTFTGAAIGGALGAFAGKTAVKKVTSLILDKVGLKTKRLQTSKISKEMNKYNKGMIANSLSDASEEYAGRDKVKTWTTKLAAKGFKELTDVSIPVAALFEAGLMTHELSAGSISQEKIKKIESVFEQIETTLTGEFHQEIMASFESIGKEKLHRDGIVNRIKFAKTGKETLTNKRTHIMNRIQDTRRMMGAWHA